MIELLAPAGNPEALRGAVYAGADAVYFGAQTFNARAEAGNFGPDELERAFSFCRTYGVKAYITLNTLVSDRELPDALALVDGLCALGGPDALIVQDLGLAAALHRRYPALPLHASTQMGVHNTLAVPLLREREHLRAARLTLLDIAHELFKKARLARERDDELILVDERDGAVLELTRGIRLNCNITERRRFIGTRNNVFTRCRCGKSRKKPFLRSAADNIYYIIPLSCQFFNIIRGFSVTKCKTVEYAPHCLSHTFGNSLSGFHAVFGNALRHIALGSKYRVEGID